MATDRNLMRRKLNALWTGGDIRQLPLDGSRYAIISDLHMGNGGAADDFTDNEEAMKRALAHYRREGFTLIILGDLEELWQFDLDEVVNRYKKSVYGSIHGFGDDRVIRVFGNHDSDWFRPPDPVRVKQDDIRGADEAIRLVDATGAARVLLVHGHQGSTTSDKKAWSSRFFVRVFRKVESVAEALGADVDPSLPRSEIKKNYEEVFHDWGVKNRAMVVCGHSHRAAFASKSYATRLREERNLQWEAIRQAANDAEGRKLVTGYRKRIEEITAELGDEGSKDRDFKTLGANPLPCYFNSGCGLYPSGPTAVEIADGEIRLVRWRRRSAKGEARQELQNGNLSDYFARIDAAR